VGIDLFESDRRLTKLLYLLVGLLFKEPKVDPATHIQILDQIILLKAIYFRSLRQTFRR